jgi:hypothetical protein
VLLYSFSLALLLQVKSTGNHLQHGGKRYLRLASFAHTIHILIEQYNTTICNHNLCTRALRASTSEEYIQIKKIPYSLMRLCHVWCTTFFACLSARQLLFLRKCAMLQRIMPDPICSTSRVHHCATTARICQLSYLASALY